MSKGGCQPGVAPGRHAAPRGEKSVDEDGVGRYLCFTSGTDGDVAAFPRALALYSNSEPEDCVTSRY